MAGFGAAEHLGRFGDLTLLGKRGGQVGQRQRAPRVAGAIQDGRCRCQQRGRGRRFTAGDQHLGQQHLADRPAGLGQLGEIGEPARGVVGGVDLAGHQQGGGLSESDGEAQQAGVLGAQRPLHQGADVGKSAHPSRAQRRRAGRPRHRHIRGIGRRQHLGRDLQ